MANQQPNNNFRTSKLIQEILVGLRDDKTENVVDLSNGLLNDDDVKRMCVFLPRNVTMDSLIARHNNLTYKSGQAFAQALAFALAQALPLTQPPRPTTCHHRATSGFS